MKKLLTLLTIALSLVIINHSCKPKEEEPGSIYGVVTDKATGEPVKTAGVELSPLGLKTVTGSEGQFEFNELEAGDYNLLVTKTGYVDLVSNTIVVKSAQTAKGDVQIEKLPAALKVVDDKGEEIDSLDFGEQYDDVSRMFSIFNDGTEVLNYEIVKTASWITSLSVTEGSLEPGTTKPVVVNIDRDKLAVGDNMTTINVTSNNGSKQLSIHAEKLPASLLVVNNEDKPIDELDFGSNTAETSRTFYLQNTAKPSLNYQIAKDAEWISSISSTQGTIEGNSKLSIVVLINREKLVIGENVATLNITSDNGSKQLTVKANRLAPELVLVDDNGNEIKEINYGSDFDNLSRSFNVYNNGTMPLDYQVSESSEWMTISNTGGTIQGGVKVPVMITVDLNKLPVGNNSTIINVISEYGNKQLTVKANKLAPELVILNDAGNEISEIDYASNFDNLSRTFNIKNNGVVGVDYQITKSVDWLTLSNESGTLKSKETKAVVMTIDINKLPVGDNTTLIHISSEYGNKQLTVKATKLAPELVILNDAGNEISEIDYASNFDNLSRSFNIKNNGIVSLNYQITKTVDWLTINNVEGTLQAGATTSVVMTIDINKLPVGDNTAMLNISSEYGNKQLTVKASKLSPELIIQNNDGSVITKLDFGTSNTSMTFNIYNKSYETINYQITKTADWIESINNMEGTIEAGLKKPIVVVINRTLLPLGDNSTLLQITSDIGSKQLEVKCSGGYIFTSDATDITGTTAKLKGSTTNSTYTEKGFYFGENLNVTTKYVVEGNDFSYQLSDLTEGKTYYYKAYLIHNNITYYGDVKEFSTKCLYAGHEYVDLGLPSGLRWATCNSGAGSPEEYGNYLTFEEAEDATWGGNWRCPTKSEWEELKSNCAWTWTTKDGVNGYEVVGSNGNSIFLPAAGYRNGYSLYDVGSKGRYWSSTPKPNSSSSAYYFYFSSNGQNMDDYDHRGTQSVRLVAE